MPLRKLRSAIAPAGKGAGAAENGGKKSKRQLLGRIFQRGVHLFDHRRRHKGDTEKDIVIPAEEVPTPTQQPEQQGAYAAGVASPEVSPKTSTTSRDAVNVSKKEKEIQDSSHTPPKEEEKPQPQPLSESQLHTLFSGAPHFGLEKKNDRVTPHASFPWDFDLAVRDVSDCAQLAHPAFSAATLRKHLPVLHQSSDQDKIYLSFDVEVEETPSMLSTQGIESGTVGFVNFLEQPIADALVRDLEESQSSSGYLEAARNKEQMQTNPERLGIRKVQLNEMYGRLQELGDLIEVFQDSPQRMTLLNNQSSGDLYANLFGKFLTPPRYDDSADDPTGMKVQIDTLFRILRLKGIWYDFSMVEWRIRLGQILWGDGGVEVPESAHDGQLWSEKESLLLQITLACELLLRLDAVTSMDPDVVKSEMRVTPDDYQGYLQLKSRKTDWDLVLARRFLDNIVVVKGPSTEDQAKENTSRGLLGLLSSKTKEVLFAEPEFTLLPRHQTRQLSGLVCFAESIKWPDLEVVVNELSLKLGIAESPQEQDQQQQQPIPAYRHFLEPTVSSSLSVYGTPLATPRSGRDSYFGSVSGATGNSASRPVVERTESQTLNIPLSTTLMSHATETRPQEVNVGGWLSRSYLTGLILPGEAISHFLISTLLENDKLAIAALDETANLYGGFVYAERTWWSKNCIIGRVLACAEGAAECMGWIMVPRVPEALPDGWYSVKSEQAPQEQPVRITSGITAEDDQVFRDSAWVPDGITVNVLASDLILPLDSDTPPVPSVVLSDWNLAPTTPELPATGIEPDELFTPPADTESHIATVTFASFRRGTSHTFTLAHDVHFITSFPCTPPKATAPIGETPIVQRPRLSRPPSSIHSTGASKRLSRLSSRRNSHGFEPLMSHPPDSPSVAPVRAAIPDGDGDVSELGGAVTGVVAGTSAIPISPRSASAKPEPMRAHPLHTSYKFKIVPVTNTLDPTFSPPFLPRKYASSQKSSHSGKARKTEAEKTILVLDAREARDLELLARAWCAERGFHAVISRVGRTCLGCSVREARGLGVAVVIRV